MAKKKEDRKEPVTSFYDLHTDAVDDLVKADSSNTPRYSKEELNKYRHRSRFRLSPTVKMILAKWWGYGAACFFVFWGLGMYVQNSIDMLFVAGVIMGMGINLVLNHFLRSFEEEKGEAEKWIMVGVRGVPGMLLDVLYAILVLYLVMLVYSAVNLLFSQVSFYLGVEPILFGLAYLGCDRLCLAVKHTLQHIIADARKAGR